MTTVDGSKKLDLHYYYNLKEFYLPNRSFKLNSLTPCQGLSLNFNLIEFASAKKKSFYFLMTFLLWYL